jgi:hypothetical protein
MAVSEPSEVDTTSTHLLRARQDKPWELHIQESNLASWLYQSTNLHYRGKKSDTQDAHETGSSVLA